MKQRSLFLFLALAASALLLQKPLPMHAAPNPPSEGDSLPEMRLPVPQKAEELDYLGISRKDFFTIPEVKAELVIVEVFSMYCPHCQKEAPAVNELYKMIEADQELKRRIKIIGIGAGNSTYEVETFKKHYSVPFPLVPDPDYKTHDAIGKVRTPHFMVVRLQADGSHKVIYSQAGGFGEPKELLNLLLSKAKMK